MSDVFLTLVVPAADAPLARSVAGAMDPGGAGMWNTPLSPSGAAPATHYISTGYVPPAWQVIVPTQTWELEDGVWVETGSTPGDPVAVYQGCVAAGLSVTLADIEGLFAVADVTAQDWPTALDRLDLAPVVTPE